MKATKRSLSLVRLCILVIFVSSSSVCAEAQKRTKPKNSVAAKDINKVDWHHSRTPLQIASENEDLYEVNRLLQKGAKVDVLDYSSRETALYISVRHRYKAPDRRVVKALLRAGANPNIPTHHTADQGATPLIAAVIEADISIVKLLLENGADPNLTDDRGYNAYMIAVVLKENEKADLLKPLTKKLMSPAEEKRARAEKTGKFFKNDTAEIYYETHGAHTGTPLILLHGGPGFDHQYFLANSVFEEIGKSRPVVFYDQRGAGNSSDLRKGNYTPTVADQVEDLENLRKHLGYEKIDLAGHSWGGFLAMAYAAKYPQQISHLTLIDSMSPSYSDTDMTWMEDDYPREHKEMKLMAFASGWNAGWWYPIESLARRSLVAYMKMLFAEPKNRDAFIAGSKEYTFNPHLNAQLNDSADHLNLVDAMQNLKLKTLIIHGLDDHNINPDDAKSVQKLIPQSELVMFGLSGHLPFYEEPDKFVRVMSDFLGDQPIRDREKQRPDQ